MPDKKMRTWKVGAVAETSGLTVRTLHHWDEIDLLSPSHRGPGGHREYTEDDLGRLYVVLVLRDLGLGLESIRNCLNAGLDPRRVFVDHLAHINQTIDALSRVRDRVADLVALDDGKRTSYGPEHLLSLIRETRPRAEEILKRHLSEEQQTALATGAAAVGPALPYLMEIEWPHLYQMADKLRSEGASPDDPRVQRIVARMDELSALFSGKDTAAGAGVRAAWHDDPAAMSGQPEQTAGPWRELARFVAQARAVPGSQEGEPA